MNKDQDNNETAGTPQGNAGGVAGAAMQCPKCGRQYEARPGLNCGDCLMEHAEIVALVPVRSWGIGDPVWARMGGYGWRPAVIKLVGRTKWIWVDFEAQGKRITITQGKREAKDLLPRNPKLKGKDKPTPAKAAALSAVENRGDGK